MTTTPKREISRTPTFENPRGFFSLRLSTNRAKMGHRYRSTTALPMLVNLNAMTKRSILKPLRALATKSAFLIPGFPKSTPCRHAEGNARRNGVVMRRLVMAMLEKGRPFIKSPLDAQIAVADRTASTGRARPPLETLICFPPLRNKGRNPESLFHPSKPRRAAARHRIELSLGRYGPEFTFDPG